MTTISVCMIVKDEEAVLKRCLDSLSHIYDELIIVDTGSSDHTVEIAASYTDKVYHFTWTGSFADARNYAFSKATKDYIYSADADEVIDLENQKRFLVLKETLLPEIEIVQMKYIEKGIQTVLNTREEYRPKLYKRERTFTWIDPVHETIRTLPVVFDSDIEIEHAPLKLHASRDFSMIEAAYWKEGTLSSNLLSMYVRELYKCGDLDALERARRILDQVVEKGTTEELFSQIQCVYAKYANAKGLVRELLKATSKLLAGGGCSECCCELGDYFLSIGDEAEASLWYYNAIYETQSILDASKQDAYPKEKLKNLKIGNEI